MNSSRALHSALILLALLSIVCVPGFAKEQKPTGRSLLQLLKLRQADERYAVRTWEEEHPELVRNPRALSEYALNYATMGWLSDAQKASAKAVELAPTDDYVLASRALVLHLSKNSSALWAARKAVALRANARNLAILAEIMHSRQPEKAAEMLSQARVDDPESFDIVAASARISLVKLKGDEALATLSTYLRKHPKDMRALMMRAEVLDSMGRLKDAVKELNAVLSLMPDHTFALQKRAEIFRREKDNVSAAADMRRLLALHTDLPAKLIANKTLAQSLESNGDLNGALVARKSMIKIISQINHIDFKNLNSPLPSTFVKDIVECCRLEVQLKHFASALPKLTLVLSTYPNNTEARALHAETLEGLSRWKEALEDWSKLIDRHPSYPKWFSNRARVNKKLGNDAAAKQDLSTAAKLEQ